MARFGPVAAAALIGAAGALGARLLGLPAPDLTGPAILAAAAGALGARIEIPQRLRAATFLILGIAIGGGVTPEALREAARWPISLAALAAALLAIQLSGAALLGRWRRYDRETALLAACPGHMSFVIGLGASGRGELRRIVLAHAVRVLLLTLGAPALAVSAFGAPKAGQAATPTAAEPLAFLALAAASLALAIQLQRRGAPAALLLGGLIATGFANASGLVSGGAPQPLLTVSFATMGVFIGSRFCGVSRRELARDVSDGAALTLLACCGAGLAAAGVSAATGLSPALLFVAYAPGGLEAMAAIALMLDLDPAFVAAHHTARLLLLAALVPLLLRRAGR